MPCAPWVDQALDAAGAGRLEEAVRLLEEAERACPAEPIVTRELAGVRFRQKRYAEVVPLAERYTASAPGDSLGWQLLATSHFVAGDRAAALEAWNRIGKPVTDLVRIDGTRHIRYRVLSDQIGAPVGEPLTPASLELARRRLSDVPALRRSVVGYEPVPGGMAELRVAVDERPVVEPLWQLLLANAVRAVANHEVDVVVSSPLRLGETFAAQGRWEEARPRVAIGAALPAVIGVPGVLRIGENWDRFQFADPAGNARRGREPSREAYRLRRLGHRCRPALPLAHVRSLVGRPELSRGLGERGCLRARRSPPSARRRHPGRGSLRDRRVHAAGGRGPVGERNNHRAAVLVGAGRSQLGQ